MNDKDKKALIKSLANEKNFNPQLTFVNRKWVISKVIEHLAALGLSDAQIKTQSKQIITEFKTVAGSKRNFKTGLKFKPYLNRQNLKRRIEIIYGILAESPDLRKSNNDKYFEFLLKRRYRSVLRMDYFVNPNKQGYFRYPKTCKQPLNHPFTVNKNAETHWENQLGYVTKNVGTPQQNTIYVPLNTLKRDPNDNSKAINPSQAIDLLFKKKKKPCDGNLQECGRVLTITFLDALQEAKNPEQLLRQQISIKNDLSFVSIYPVTYFPGLIEHAGPDALFEYKAVKDSDFKVGDHLYIFNHPLYKVFKPTGDWRGEHCLVYKLGNRKIKSSSGYHYGGHGMEGTLFQFYNAFLINLKTYFSRAYVIAKIHLNYMKPGSSTLPSGCTVTDQAHTLNLNGNTFACHLYRYNYQFQYRNFRKNRKRNYLFEKDFLIIQFLTENIFIISGEKEINTVVSTNQIKNPIVLARTSAVTPGGNLYEHTEWKVWYKDTNDTEQLQPMFKKVKGKISIRHIKRSELFEAPFKYVDPINKTIQISQPKLDLSPAYTTFLTTNGAI